MKVVSFMNEVNSRRRLMFREMNNYSEDYRVWKMKMNMMMMMMKWNVVL